ncbi:centromere protein L [Aplochiton taeniatus]
MEERSSGVKTPLKNVTAQAQRRSKGYGLSRRSGIDPTSYIGYTPGLTSRRITTSRRTPKPRKITERVDPEQIALLVKKEWQLSYVTPLHQFRHTQIKSYSRQLSAFIVSEKQQGMGVEVGAEAGFKVTFSVILGVAETDEDAETVLIQVHSKPAFVGKDDADKLVWSGWLTCVSGDLEYLRSLPDDFVCLPLFCTSGAEALTTLVKSWFQRTFDCCFGSLCINSTNLQWLAALWTGCHSDTSIQYLKLVWTLPAQPPMDVTYTVHPQDAYELWSSVRQGEDSVSQDNIYVEEVTRFAKGLESNFYRHFRIDLSAGRLMQVATALGSARHSGRIKISSSGYMTTILILLTECALLKMPL